MIAFIDEHRDAYGVEPICRVLPIAPSTYHAHAARRADPARLPARARSDATLMVEIRRVFEANFCVYKMRRQLAREGIVAARCTVARLMWVMGLQGVVRGKRLRTTVPGPAAACPLDRVNRQFKAPRPNALWVADFTYVATWSGFVYVAFVIDAFARRSVGWRVSRSAQAGFVLGALEQALHERRPMQGGGLVHHSDRGGNTSPCATRTVSPRQALSPRSAARGQLRQRPRRNHQRPVQGRGDPPARAVAHAGSRRVRHAGVGRLVQPPPVA